MLAKCLAYYYEDEETGATVVVGDSVYDCWNVFLAYCKERGYVPRGMVVQHGV